MQFVFRVQNSIVFSLYTLSENLPPGKWTASDLDSSQTLFVDH